MLKYNVGTCDKQKASEAPRAQKHEDTHDQLVRAPREPPCDSVHLEAFDYYSRTY